MISPLLVEWSQKIINLVERLIFIIADKYDTSLLYLLLARNTPSNVWTVYPQKANGYHSSSGAEPKLVLNKGKNIKKKNFRFSRISQDVTNKKRKEERRRKRKKMKTIYRSKRNMLWTFMLLVAGGTCINVLCSYIKTPLYLDSIGTMLTAAVGGYIPGVLTGLITNFIKSLSDHTSVYYAVLNVAIAIFTAFMLSGNKKWKWLITAIGAAGIGGVAGSFLTRFIYGFDETALLPVFRKLFEAGRISSLAAELLNDFTIDLTDKAVSTLAVFICVVAIKRYCREDLWIRPWKQTPTTRTGRINIEVRKTPLQHKVFLLLTVSTILLSVISVAISLKTYKEKQLEENKRAGTGIAKIVADIIDGDKIEAYIKNPGHEEYVQTKEKLKKIKQNVQDIQYLYVYQIKEDGCHVVFDLDTEETPGSLPGTVIPFDKSFEKYIPDLIAGNRIEPIVTDDTYGWLLTVYEPVYGSDGKCKCYAAVDISMGNLRLQARKFAAKLVSLFAAAFLVIVCFAIWYTEYSIVLPLNAMSEIAVSLNNEKERVRSLQKIRDLRISTGDEIENVYIAFMKSTEDCVSYAEEIKEQSEKLQQMQSGLITVLADVVESRDQCTGNHIRNTAAYTEIILDELSKHGKYEGKLTDEYIQSTIQSAPLHDIGKIKIPDAILNKPGKLSDTEYEEMKKHTTEGMEIIDEAIHLVPDPMYLTETKNMAEYHHERWDGKGYPVGLQGEEIPLSARIMAVADVYDALVSERSYKKGMDADKAFYIIQEGSGTHFDPNVVEAFLARKEDVIHVSRYGTNEV